MANTTENTGFGFLKNTFKKEERLCSKKVIDKLFSEGDSFLVFPLKIVFLNTSIASKYPVQAAFMVGKKRFKKAVHRNRIKRKMHEAYRLNKNNLYNNLIDKQLAIFVIFIGIEIPEYTQVEAAMKKGIKKLLKKVFSD